MNSIANETEFVEVDAFLNAEAAHAKDLGLETDTAVEVAGGTCVHLYSGPLLFEGYVYPYCCCRNVCEVMICKLFIHVVRAGPSERFEFQLFGRSGGEAVVGNNRTHDEGQRY